MIGVISMDSAVKVYHCHKFKDLVVRFSKHFYFLRKENFHTIVIYILEMLFFKTV